MRICYFARANYALFQRRAARVARLGHEVHVLSLQPGEIEGCTVHQLPNNPMLARLKLQYVAALPAASRLLAELQPDIVDLHGVSSYGIFALLPRQAPLVATVYGPDIYDHAKQFWHLRKIAQIALRRADLIFASTVATSDYVREILKMDIGDRFAMRSWGIPADSIQSQAMDRRATVRREYSVDDDTHVILHSRQITEIWQIPTLVAAMPAILAIQPRSEFWFVYPPPNRAGEILFDQLQKQATALGVADRIRWLGYHPYDRLMSILHAADVYVCIGKDDLLASSLLEAMATGLVPVLSNLSAYHEVIQDGINGYLLHDVAPEQVAAKVNEVLDNFSAIQPTVAEHNWELIAANYDETATTEWLVDRYAELISTHHRHQVVSQEDKLFT